MSFPAARADRDPQSTPPGGRLRISLPPYRSSTRAAVLDNESSAGVAPSSTARVRNAQATDTNHAQCFRAACASDRAASFDRAYRRTGCTTSRRADRARSEPDASRSDQAGRIPSYADRRRFDIPDNGSCTPAADAARVRAYRCDQQFARRQQMMWKCRGPSSSGCAVPVVNET